MGKENSEKDKKIKIAKQITTKYFQKILTINIYITFYGSIKCFHV